MSRSRAGLVLLFCLLLAFSFSLALLLPIAHASEQMSIQYAGAEDWRVPRQVEGARSAPVVIQTPVNTTTLDVAIHSPPLAVRDSNKVDEGPRIFVVHAVVTNTGHLTATDLSITLDYQDDPANGWVLVPGENAERAQDSLAPGEKRHSFWFASYPAGVGQSHQYQVTATAANATAVSTTENVFGNPEPGQTVATAGFLDTGNNGQIALQADLVVGVAFTMTVDYDLGNNPQALTFSPAGNLGFDPGRVELREVRARFHDSGETQETSVANQIYFPSVPELPDGSTPSSAEVTYTFLTLRPGSNVLCPYLGIDYGTTNKYDNEYCEGDRRTVITGTATFDLAKEVSDVQVQEGERLTYTLHYTNTGDVSLEYAWLWDDVDPQVGQIITPTASPAPDPTETGGNRVAWDLGTVPPAGQPGSSGTVTFTIMVDAPADDDLEDGQAIVNDGYFGITEGTLPPLSAVTDTVTSTVMAPTIIATKTDGVTTVEDGQRLTYTISVRNEGSVPAVGLSASDALPEEVVLGGSPSPPAVQSGQTVSWDSLGDLAPGNTLTMTVPVSVPHGTSSFTHLLNEFFLEYGNEAGHMYQTMRVTDTTTVMRPAAFVEGYVFEDSNADGVFDPGESGLAGVQLSLPGAFTPTVTTDSAGYYRFRVEAEGVHSVSETDPPDTISTTPNRVAVDLVLGETYVVNFGDMSDDNGGGDFAAIHGTVFNDEDGDGAWDGDEAGIAGVTVTLDGAITATTDVYGSYSFGAVATGVHTVEETDLPDTISTTPNRVAVSATAGESYAVNFGDMPAGGGEGDSAAIHGTVFSDEDGDGVWDGDEAGIAGVTVTLDGVVTATTDVYGSYSFGAVTPAQYTVEETDPPDYISTTPNRVAVSATAGESYAVNFGDMPAGGGGGGDPAAIHGTVYSDDDGDGVWDTDEVGIAGVTVTLNSVLTRTTDSFGSYSFGAVTPGQHTVEETDLPDYISTTPNSISLTAEAENAYTVNFGDLFLTDEPCTADDYEDDDTAALATPLGVGDVAEHDFCDADAADWHTFTAEPGDVYTITTASGGLRADTVLSLFDTDGETLLAANDDFAGTTDFSSRIVWRPPAAGTYYVRISNRAGLSEWLTGYDVWIERQDNHYRYLPLVLRPTTVGPSHSGRQPLRGKTSGAGPASEGPAGPTGVIDHCGPDAYEVDDTWEQAQPITPGAPQRHTFDSDPDLFAVDKDFVVLESGPGGAIEASSSSTAVSVLLEVYDARGQALNRSGVDQLSWPDAPMGRYYLGVTPLTPAYSCDGSVSYELTVNYAPLFRVLLPVTTKR